MSVSSIDPIAFEIGPLVFRWYALAYVVGLLAGWWHVIVLVKTGRVHFPLKVVDDLFLFIVLGIIVGGRLGYVALYHWSYYVLEPLEILAVWNGGMSFHGALLGVVAALFFVASRNHVPVLSLGDAVAPIVPLGLMFGRLANFANGELYGRASDVSWSLIFPRGGQIMRHPSQLYEALLEGLLLLILMLWLTYVMNAHKRVGFLTGVFLAGYGCARVFAEFYREPDVQIGYVLGFATLGQILSLPLIIAGLLLVVKSKVSSYRG